LAHNVTLAPLMAVDWGTSSLRAALVSGDGIVQAQRAVDRGILTVEPGGHAAVLREHFGDWWSLPGVRCLISGMAGSRQGWMEAPYCTCPSGLDELAASLAWVEPGRVAIVPGMRCERDGVPDVMRGEETQVLGASALLGIDSAWMVLPGTHSKWVQVHAGQVVGFATWMTGEFYGMLREHSILARMLPTGEETFDGPAFDAGVALALRGCSLMQSAFGARTLALLDRLAPSERLSHLSGVVIGEELRCRPAGAGARVVLVGSEALTMRYERALKHCGVYSLRVGEQAAWYGLHVLAGRWPS